jgi:hypothetical protein
LRGAPYNEGGSGAKGAKENDVGVKQNAVGRKRGGRVCGRASGEGPRQCHAQFVCSARHSLLVTVRVQLISRRASLPHGRHVTCVCIDQSALAAAAGACLAGLALQCWNSPVSTIHLRGFTGIFISVGRPQTWLFVGGNRCSPFSGAHICCIHQAQPLPPCQHLLPAARLPHSGVMDTAGKFASEWSCFATIAPPPPRGRPSLSLWHAP